MRARKLRFLSGIALICLLAFTFAMNAEAHGPYRGGSHALVVPSYPYYYPYWGYGYPYGGYGWGGWGWGTPYWGYQPYYNQTIGWIKIKDRAKADEILINDAYAGTVEKMKTFGLDPGKYTIRVRRDGRVILDQTLYVVAGKTVIINMDGK